MKIALVTNKNLRHKYWACTMFSKHDVRLIIHPSGKKNLLKRIRSKNLMRYGLFYFLLKILSLIYNKIGLNSMSSQIAFYEKKYFSNYETEYNKIPKEIIHEVETVNDTAVIELVKKNDIDIICFLGGDLAKKDFINASKVASLNFHSGISPYYNGNKTIFQAVSDYRPNFAGGTLMYISERIDGGGILSHFLPKIELEDNAATLFMKGIMGSAKLYSQFIEYIEKHDLPKGVLQERTFRYIRNVDWNIINDIKLKKSTQKGINKIYWRDETIIDYFGLKKDDISVVYSSSLGVILKK